MTPPRAGTAVARPRALPAGEPTPQGERQGRAAVHAAATHPLGAAAPRRAGPADLRLLPPALGAWGGAALALGVSGRTAATGVAVGCVLAAVLLLRARRPGPGRTPGPRGPGASSAARPGGADAGSSGPRPAARAPAPAGDQPARSLQPARKREPAPSPEPARPPAPRRPRPRRTAAVTAACTVLCAAAAAASAALHAADLHRGPVPGLAAGYGEATAEVTVTGDPRRTGPGVRGSRRTPGLIVVPAEARRVTVPGAGTRSVRTPVLLLVRLPETARAPAGGGSPAAPAARGSLPEDPAAAWLRLLPSTGLRVEARFAPPGEGRRGGRPPAALLRVREAAHPVVVRPPSTAQRVAGRLRAGLRQATDGLPPDARALLPGLVVGDTSRIPDRLHDAFRTTDMLHLLAVSGGNLTVLLVLLIGPPGTAARAERRGLAPRLGLSLRVTAVLAALLVLGFVLVCRPEPSVLRAAACGLITIAAIGTGRRRALLPALAAAVLLLVLYDPWLARDAGFLLSVLATGSLLTLAPRWSRALRRRGVPGRLAEALAAAAAAQAACAPVVALLAGHVSLVAVPCNLLAEFAVAPATVLGFAALGAAPLALPVAEALAGLAAWPAGTIAVIARTGAAVPGATLAWPDGSGGALLLAALLAGLIAALPPAARRLRPRARLWLSAAAAALLLLALVRPPPLTRVLTGWPPAGWRLVACDVGQGDALVLNAGDGSAVLVDAGPDPEAVDRCLRTLGVTALPLLVLTHFHADHVAGLPGALRGRAVGAVQVTGLEEPREQAEFVRRTARAAGVPVVRSVPGERRRLGPLRWRVLWPPGRFPAGGAAAAPGGEDEANDASVTLLVHTGRLTALLPGDLEPPAQRRLLTAHPDLPPVDVLKVAHHGSAFQDPALLARLRPRIALISCGEENPYGHPSPRTLATLGGRGATVLRTDTDGALAVTAGGRVRTSAGRAGRAGRRARRAPGAGRSAAQRARWRRRRPGPAESRTARSAVPGRPGASWRTQPCDAAVRGISPAPASRRAQRSARPVPRGPGRVPPGPPGRRATARPRRRPPRPAPPGPPAAPPPARSGPAAPPRPPRPRPARAAPECVVRRSPGHCPGSGGRDCRRGVGCCPRWLVRAGTRPRTTRWPPSPWRWGRRNCCSTAPCSRWWPPRARPTRTPTCGSSPPPISSRAPLPS